MFRKMSDDDEECEVVLIDFGLMVPVEESTANTGMLNSTTSFYAPERYREDMQRP